MGITADLRHARHVRSVARTVLRPVVGRRRVPGTPLVLRFPARQHLGLLARGADAFEPELAEHIRRGLGPGRTGVDIGANIGLHTLLMADLVGSAGVVHAFEPDPQSGRWLLENIRAGGLRQVTPWLLAVSSEDGISELHLDLEASLSTSLLDDWKPGLERGERQRVRVPTARLDSLALGQVDFIKIDVEGVELSVLEGARETIRESRPVLLVEVIVRDHLAAVGALLDDLGYDVVDAKTGAVPGADADYSGNIVATPRT